MTAQSELHSLAVKVGEISGQLRELIHNNNNMATKVDGILRQSLLAPSAEDYAQLAQRVATLEAKENRRDGATGLGAAILKSPVLGWIVGIVVAAFAAIKGGLFK